ncbi:membrane protein [Aeromonas salmonicida subsp. smithia]|uniref:OmpA family protein n=7 Tax=Aeromonas salmonicida TaxID=645 RepID=UPI00073163F0|nr:OmpA family protein [Aeromonas salmonicida]KTA94243.1 membrane protein [Aeromonas salmonicida subsp. smithia]
MKMKMAPALIALAIAAMGTSTAQAADDWYTGIGAGWAYGHDLNDFGKDADKDATALTLFGGYNFTENLGAELGYLSTGDWDVQGTDFSSQGATLSVIGRLPLGDIFSVFAEGGGYLYHVKSINGGDDNLAPLAGLGLTAKLHDWVDIQARYRYLVRVGDDSDNDKVGSGTQRWVSDISTATLELVIHPNRSKTVAPAPAPVLVAPPPPPAPEPVDQTFNLSSDVLFAFGKAELKPEGMQALDALYQQIVDVQPKDGSALVMGYTDRIGSDINNLALSEARASTVANFLIGKGLPADKVSIQGNGESNPVTGSQCDAIKAKAALIDCLGPDRRVEVRVTGVQGTPEAPVAEAEM